MEEKNTGIKIENVFEEYKEQLKLMEKQYGQEEDLYPWIYMLLMESEKINNLSMRQVAGATWANCVRGREMLRGYAGFPDIAIVDKDFYTININNGIESMKKDIANMIARGLKPKNDVHIATDILLSYMIDNEEMKEFLRNYWYLYNIDKIRGCIEVKILGDKLIYIEPGEDKVLKIGCEKKKWFFKVDDTNLISINTGIEFKDIIQLLGELLWYGKVLYTNGNEWKYLEVTKCSNNKKIKSIVDLRRILYKKCVYVHKPTDLWYKLISELQELKRNKLEIKIKCLTKSVNEKKFLDWFKEICNFFEEKQDEY